MQYIFLDTNIFIHFVDFDQIDWSSETNVPDQVVITIAPIVIDELDKHKYNKNQKISRRVKRLLPKIENSCDSPEKLQCQIKLIEKRPDENTFSINSLDKSQQDDCLLATILEFNKTVDINDSIIYITNDVGPRLKARSLKIKVQKLNEKYLLPNEPEEIEIRNLSLQKELNELKSKTPIVKLCFLDNSSLKIFERENLVSKDTFIQNALKKVKDETLFLKCSPPKKDDYKKQLITFSKNPLFTLSESQVNEYNRQLTEYFKKYEEYINQLYTALHFQSQSIKIEFLLENTGTAPALDIDVEIHFPDGFDLITKNDFPKIKTKPDSPYKPKSSYDINFSMNPISIPIISSSKYLDTNQTQINQPIIKKTNSYNVSFHRERLKHNQTDPLEPLYAKFNNIKIAKGFQIDYTLIISNLPRPVNGQLNINFEN